MSTVSNTTMRLSGLASTLDTESIVRDLMEVSRIKVDQVGQQKQILEWKQEFYKEIATKLYEFQTKFYNSSSSWSDELSKLSASYNSNYISVNTSSNSTAGNIYIDDIISLASSTKVVSSTSVSSNPSIEINTDNLSELVGKSIVVNLNGIEKLLTFTDRTYATSVDVQGELQSLINNSFGNGKATVNLYGNTMSLNAENSTIILKTPTDGTEPSSVLTFDSYSSNRVDFNVSLSSATLASPALNGNDVKFTINGKPFEFTSANTLNDIMTKINSSSAGVQLTYSILTDKFTLTSTATGSANDITYTDTAGTLMSSLFGAGVKTSGTDAVVKLNANGSTNAEDMITITRSTNIIDVDGTTITLLSKATDESSEKINITLSRENESIISKIKSFVDDYNSLLSSITTKLSEEHEKNYTPLTNTQKEDMSETEIELWTKKAKIGLLANDTYLKAIAAELRSIFYTQVSELGDSTASIGLMSEIGISTTVYSDKGKLTIDETKLKAALINNSEKVMALFKQKSDKAFSLYSTAEVQQERFNESGIFDRLGDFLSKNLSKVGKKGVLINLVGSPTDTYTGETDYSKRISALENKMEDMEESLVDEENRYWRQFTAMESALAKLNQQSAWLSNMLGDK
ncbi:MAG: hypothetical protein A2Y15_04710 [Clostridiales bacterium GWF2_36_10]|nr:MAG: hypothetical protein A2Y15_04710 [Clostridiales bacterium GWF2_36_10]HAN20865.1 hypothetical protein [Clostridiales bacterium]